MDNQQFWKRVIAVSVICVSAILVDCFIRESTQLEKLKVNAQLEQMKACTAAKGTWVAGNCLLPSIMEVEAGRR